MKAVVAETKTVLGNTLKAVQIHFRNPYFFLPTQASLRAGSIPSESSNKIYVNEINFYF